MYMHAYTLYGFVRPFGCFILLSAYESDGPQLYGIESSGVTYVRRFCWIEGDDFLLF
jgi:20S proteasome subunit alpha 7